LSPIYFIVVDAAVGDNPWGMAAVRRNSDPVGEGDMVSASRRAGVLLGVVVVMAGATVAAQERGRAAVRHPSLDGVAAFNVVESRTTVVACPKAEGAHVARSDLVCELDVADLLDRLRDQEITVKAAEASYLNAKLNREVAEIGVTEYLEGIYKQELETVLGEIALAQSDLKRAEERLDWSHRMFSMGYISLGENISDKLAMRRAKFAMEQAQTKRAVLEQYTKSKTILERKSGVEKERSEELAKQAVFELEGSKRKSLAAQVERCKVVAPAAGTVRYALDVEKGAVVHDGQLLFRIIPDAAPATGKPAAQ
jgi:HlyD family secretion protein